MTATWQIHAVAMRIICIHEAAVAVGIVVNNNMCPSLPCACTAASRTLLVQ